MPKRFIGINQVPANDSIDSIKKFFKKEHPGIRVVEDDDGDKVIFDSGERSLIIGRHRGDIIDGYGGDDIIVSQGGHDRKSRRSRS